MYIEFSKHERLLQVLTVILTFIFYKPLIFNDLIFSFSRLDIIKMSNYNFYYKYTWIRRDVRHVDDLNMKS